MAFSCNITDITSLAGNNIINYINLYSNVNLKNVKTLGDCINLKEIYLANNEAMIGTEVSEALGNSETHILQNCGSNYSLPNKYLIYFSNLTKYDLSNLDLTDESDEINAMKNKTNVTSLNLAGNSKLSNEKLQEILSTMTGLKALKLQNCSNLSSIDFIGQNKVTGLIELDIRGTSSSLTDLSNLEEYALDLQTLALNNYNVDFSKIQNTINRFDVTTQNPYSWRGKNPFEFRGLVLSGDCSQYSFENCTNIKQLISNVGAHYTWDSTYGILDLTPCVNMKFIYTWGRTGTYKLPSSIVNIEHTQGGVYDLSLCYNLKTYYAEIGNSMITELKTLNPKAKLQRISSMRGTPTDLSFLQYIDTSELTELWIYSNGVYYQPSQLNSVQGIEYATNLKSLELSGSATLDGNINLSSLTKLTSLSIHSNIKLDKVILTNENGIGVTNLVALNASNCEIVEISGLEYNVSLENLYINTNKIHDISNISNLINLKEIYINNNAISDLSPLQNLINNCLNKTVLFKKIYMNDNVIQNYSTNGVDNIKCIVDLYNAGCKTIDVRNNSFSDTTELSKYSGISY